MHRRLLLATLAMPVLLCGCPAAPVIPLLGGTALGGIIATATIDAANVKHDVETVDTAATDTLVAVKPLNDMLCYVEPWKPHSVKAQAAIKAFCANLPSNPKQLWDQTLAIYKAVKAADAAP